MRISRHRFLDKENAKSGEARQLLTEALDFSIKQGSSAAKEKKEYDAPRNALPEEFFPPCINHILNGLEDGRKRALFILLNFFTSIGWDYGMIEKRLREWNAKNREPLREVYLIGQLRYHKQNHKKVLPPNCSNEMYMAGLGINRLCDELHKKGIKNPVQYTLRRARFMNNNKVDNKAARKQ